jgi:monoamine oxidase
MNGKFHETLDEIQSRDWEITYKRLLEDYKKLIPDSKEKEKIDHQLDKIDWYRYLVDNGCKDTDLQLRDLIDSTDFGESIRQVSAFAAISEYSSSSPDSMNQMDKKIKGGNLELAKKLASFFEDKIITRKHVVTIEQKKNDYVKVYCEDGSSFVGDKLICTAPAFAVTQIDWRPGLPEGMFEALKSLQYSRINKNAVLFNERIWRDEAFDMITDMPGHYFYHATKNQRGQTGVLNCYTIGDKAQVMANQSSDVRNDIVAQTLSLRFPCAGKHIIDNTVYYWGDDKYSRGAYAVYGKGQYFDIHSKIIEPHENTFFAGEHLSETWGGFMEGALETGIAAAKTVARAI